MKAEMGRKLSKRQGYAPVPGSRDGEAQWMGVTGAQKKTPAEAPGLEACQYGGKALPINPLCSCA
jgi:hypothetical protein